MAEPTTAEERFAAMQRTAKDCMWNFDDVLEWLFAANEDVARLEGELREAREILCDRLTGWAEHSDEKLQDELKTNPLDGCHVRWELRVRAALAPAEGAGDG